MTKNNDNVSFFRGRPSKRRKAAYELRPLSDQQRDEIRELFEDVYVTNRWKIIRMNFMRGLVLGFGTFLGGTIVVALIIWLLSKTTDIFPWANELIQALKHP